MRNSFCRVLETRSMTKTVEGLKQDRPQHCKWLRFGFSFLNKFLVTDYSWQNLVLVLPVQNVTKSGHAPEPCKASPSWPVVKMHTTLWNKNFRHVPIQSACCSSLNSPFYSNLNHSRIVSHGHSNSHWQSHIYRHQSEATDITPQVTHSATATTYNYHWQSNKNFSAWKFPQNQFFGEKHH